MAHVHRANLLEAGYTRFTQLQGDSSSVGKEFKGKIDLLFIDGDHSYNGVMRDIEAWTLKVKAGGVVMFHDAAPATNLTPHELHFEVQKALDDWQREHGSEWTELPSEYSIRVFKRVGEEEKLIEHNKERALIGLFKSLADVDGDIGSPDIPLMPPLISATPKTKPVAKPITKPKQKVRAK